MKECNRMPMSSEFLELLAMLFKKVEEGVRKRTFPGLVLSSKELCKSVKVKDNMCKSNLGVTGYMILGKEMKSKKR